MYQSIPEHNGSWPFVQQERYGHVCNVGETLAASLTGALGFHTGPGVRSLQPSRYTRKAVQPRLPSIARLALHPRPSVACSLAPQPLLGLYLLYCS